MRSLRPIGLGGVLLIAMGFGACGPDTPRRPDERSNAPKVDDLAPYLQPGDVLVAIDGRAVGTRAEAFAALEAFAPASGPRTIVIERAGERITLDLDAGR